MKGSIVIGPRTTIDKGVILRTYGGKISVGPDCSLNPYVILYGHGGLKIGRGVRIAAQTVIIPANHTYSDPSTYIFEQGETRQGIVIQDNVWLGTGVRVLDGTTIGEGSVVGAGSVVTKNLQKGGVFVGVPARKIASRY
ncbi:acyltransferase [Agrobacterium larrymoorei]|uniref:acyltransferase n=1 Tax=Agrobacterium larrymoorei TaxID=160699 RepID=UPI0030C43C5C